MGYIYQIRNTVNNKKYIGETIKDPEKRWKEHIYTIKQGKNCCPMLAKAVNKYGLDKFEFKVLIICFDEDRLHYEKQYIEKLNTIVPNGYNVAKGGYGGGAFIGKKHSEETKQRLREMNKVRFNNLPQEIKQKIYDSARTPEAIEKQREAMKRVYATQNKTIMSEETKQKLSNALKGKKHSEESKKKMRENASKRTHNERRTPEYKKHHSEVMTKIRGKKVYQYDDNKNLIHTFDSIKIAAESQSFQYDNFKYYITHNKKINNFTFTYIPI
jgi:group I intron endonuclease